MVGREVAAYLGMGGGIADMTFREEPQLGGESGNVILHEHFHYHQPASVSRVSKTLSHYSL